MLDEMTTEDPLTSTSYNTLASESFTTLASATLAPGNIKVNGSRVKIQPNLLFASWKDQEKKQETTEDRDRIDEILDGIIHALEKRVNQQLPVEPRLKAPSPPPAPRPSSYDNAEIITAPPLLEALVPVKRIERRRPAMRREDYSSGASWFRPVASGSIYNFGNKRDLISKRMGHSGYGHPGPRPPPRAAAGQGQQFTVQVTSRIGFNNNNNPSQGPSFGVSNDQPYRKGIVVDDHSVDIITASPAQVEMVRRNFMTSPGHRKPTMAPTGFVRFPSRDQAKNSWSMAAAAASPSVQAIFPQKQVKNGNDNFQQYYTGYINYS
ncbi:hypothetical protein HDE_08578 [Halotydeus destructor]|nr:hypothetical protein HDE_08578 [Halotydeus destructor]